MAMKRYQLLAGDHVEVTTSPDGNKSTQSFSVVRGDDRPVYVDSERDLVAEHVNKFRLAAEQPDFPKATKHARKTIKEQFDKDGDEAATERTKGKNKLGDDVTDKFPSAEAAGLRVLKKDNHYFISTEAKPNKAVNENGFRTNSQVEKAITEYTATHNVGE